MKASRLTTVLLLVAQATTGIYLIVYLFRWQWTRALICGVFFVATEVLVVSRVILQRLRSIEQRLDTAADARVHLHVVESRPAPADRFAWLRERATGMNVFLPLLLGAGVLASALAWAVEGVARRTARPALERSLALALQPIAFPAGGFLGTETPAVRRPVAARRLVVGSMALGTALLVAAAIDVVADATQTRPDALDAGVVTAIDLRFRGDRGLAEPERHAVDLIRVCTSRSFSRALPEASVADMGSGLVRVVVSADLGEHGTTRLRGCLEDTTLDRVQASVAGIVELTPAE